MIQAGDFVSGDGSGGDSIYGKNFIDENFTRRHAHAGVLSMANHGRNTNSSQFFVTLKPCPHLDGKHVVFGQVVEGMDVIRAIAKVPTEMYEKPRIPVHVFDCGEVGGKLRDKLLNDEFQQVTSAVQEHVKAREQKLKHKQLEETKKTFAEHEEEKGDLLLDEQEREQVEELRKHNDAVAQRKLDLLMKMNEARKLNNKAVVEEQERTEEGYLYEKRRNKEEYVRDKRKQQRELDSEGLSKDKNYVFDTVAQAERGKKRKSNNATTGWEVFNDDSLYRAYFKRTNKLADDDKALSQADRVKLMAGDVEQQVAKRGEFSRTRLFVDENDMDYINERNRVFNKKLERNFGEVTAPIKAKIESGHAIE